jgi:hypothetical protein
MRELQVHPAGVQIKSFAEIFHRHRRALDVPTRPTPSKRCIPARLLILADQFPQRKIACIFLIVFVGVDSFTAAGNISREIDLRQLAVIRKSRYAVIDRTFGFICVPVLKQLRNNVDHLRDMMRRPRRHLRPLIAESVEIFPKILNVRCGKFIDADPACRRFVDNAVINIGQVKDVRYLIPFEFQIPPQNVAENERAKVANMGKIPDRRPADIHPHFAFLKRVKFFDLSR